MVLDLFLSNDGHSSSAVQANDYARLTPNRKQIQSMDGDYADIVPVVAFTVTTFAFVFVCFCIFCFVMAALTSNDSSPKRAKPGRGNRLRRVKRTKYTTEASAGGPKVWTTCSAVWTAHNNRYSGIYRYVHCDGSYGYVRLSQIGFVSSNPGQSSFGFPVTIVSLDGSSAGDSGISISNGGSCTEVSSVSDGSSSDRTKKGRGNSLNV